MKVKKMTAYQDQNTLHVKDQQFNQRTKLSAYLLIAILVSFVMLVEDVLSEEDDAIDVIVEFLFFVPLLMTVWFTLGRFYNWSIKQFRLRTKNAQWYYGEVIFIAAWVLGLSVAILFIMIFFSQFLPDENEGPSFFNFTWTVWVANLISLSVVITVESFWEMLQKRTHLELQNERLTRNQERAKYQALMNQINPHFLFNSLNVLSYLVYENPRNAERFVEELSSIYRYILQLNETYLVPLKKELTFIESYIFLQKIRYQNNLIFDAKLDAKDQNLLIPPLTLELLVENAIKHNVISEEQPLSIKLYTEEDYLVVENNLQNRLEHEVISNKVGLQNLRDKFTILESKPPEFFSRNGRFIARIPLLKPEI